MNGSEESPPAVGAPGVQPWLLRHRVVVPDLPPDYCERRELSRRCALVEKRVTLLMAPGGFGKTTLLAACCGEARSRGVPTAWLSLAADDAPRVLDTYVAHAFAEAGLDFDDAPSPAVSAERLPYAHTGAVLQTLEAQDRPWVLVLDELENLTDRESGALLSFLVRGAPPCLHLALSCRELPGGLDAAMAVLGADAEVLSATDLVFSRADVARFFGFELSRRALAAVMAASGGWPVAVRMARNATGPDAAGDATVAQDIAVKWIEGRLLRGFPDRDRELVLDLGLFDWFDAALADEVTEQPWAFDRVTRMPTLSGLVVRTGATGRFRLHSLLCAYSEERRREAPESYRRIHRRLGLAMARRGETVAGMRHAVAADDPELAGRILIDAGGLGVWLRQGADQLIAADRLLTERTVASDPRLALVRCAALAVRGDLAGARRAFEAAEPVLAAAVADHGPGLDVELCMVRGIMARNGCEPVGSAAVDALMAETRRMAGLPTLDPVARGTMEFGLCLYHSLRAEFEAALEHGGRSRALVAHRSPYMALVADFQCGQVAMAQGRVKEALQFYQAGQRIATARFSGYRRLAAMGVVLKREVDLERNRVSDDAREAGVSKLLLRGGVDFGCHAAASDLAVEHAYGAGGVDAALGVLDDIWAQARVTGLPALERHLAAVRVSMLADGGRIADAERTWRAAGLPVEDADCVDLKRQSWREMEALSCARVRLRIARGEHDAAQCLARALADVAAGCGLVRTRLRALALLIAIDGDADDGDPVLDLVGEYLSLCAESGYVRPLVSSANAGAVLRGYVEAHPDGTFADRAERLVNAIVGGTEVVPVFRGKQREVLERLAAQRDKDIAAALGLSHDGVRYHVRNIFRKLDVRGRAAAVRRARELGILESG